MTTAKRPYRILHAVGSGDVVESWRFWEKGEILASETSLTYSGQFFSFCHDNQIESWVISSHPRKVIVRAGGMIVENRPKPGDPASRGIRFHLREMAYGISIILTAARYRPDLALIDSGTSHWFVFSLLRLLGVGVVSNFHNTLWPAGYPPRNFPARLIAWLTGWYLRWISIVSMGASPECQRQAEQLAGKPLRFFQYRAQYLAEHFSLRTPPDIRRRPFRIMFAGRVEKNKGGYDILAMAEKLNAMRPGETVFDICGNGSAFDDVCREVRARRLEVSVTMHGQLTRPALIDMYRRSHLVIIPTTSEFNEAFAMVAAEAVLMGRPILSNPVVPACEILRAATVLAKTDDVDDYVRNIVSLLTDPQHYTRLCAACEDLRGIFLTPSNGIGAALVRVIEFLRPGWKAAPLPLSVADWVLSRPTPHSPAE